MNRLSWSVGTLLSLALLLVVAAALGIVYLTVVPSLEHRLIDTRVSQLERASARQKVTPAAPYTTDFVESVHASTGARVVLLQRFTSRPLVMTNAQDSLGGLGPDVTDDPVALRAYTTGRPQHGTVRDGDEDYAEAARPVLGGDYVLLLRDSLQNQFGSVHLVQRRVLFSAGAALLIALLLGYGAARVFARRIKRLERAADRIAGGRFDQPVRDNGRDELGDLARAFERMRVRLSQLDDARRAFVANASHELRTPLFSLAGYLELLDDEELDEPTRLEFLDSMREQVTRLTKLASDLLDLSRLDAGRLTVELEPVDLAALCEEIVEEFGPAAQVGDHALELGDDRGSRRPRGRASSAADRPDPRRERAAPHASGDDGSRARAHARRARRPRGRGRRRRNPGRSPGAAVRAVLPARRRACVGQRARPRDRARAGRADGRDGRGRVSAPESTVFSLVLPQPAPAEPREREPAAVS